MNTNIQKLLRGEGENHLLPFFWQHGEEEDVLRTYMGVIQESGCGAVCVESRPHPDFCGPGWWRDMDIILDEARKRDMKVWILDDSHFPTGYANGALENAPASLCRQSICMSRTDYSGEAQRITIDAQAQVPPPFTPVGLEAMILPTLPKPRHYDDDTVLSVIARNATDGETVDLTAGLRDGVIIWDKPEGAWTIWVAGLSRNCGPHRSYINMMDGPSCSTLLSAVYEPHWQHYSADFGNTIAGFFSDEPELGNGHLYGKDDRLGTDQDLPFSAEMPEELEKTLGEDWPAQMYLLWDNDAPADKKARVRYAFMDAVTRLVRNDFSRQLGDWCADHGVQYIGHVVEDNNAHSRPASSLGHYFRGLDGQHMSGVDVISNQIMPQQIGDTPDMMGNLSDGEFYHFMLAKMASSAAAIEPRKRGRAMCEIFGNYGWGLSVSLQKYLVDHFLVRGVNYFVPHAFSPKDFPDTDCPPHFYAHGHNPQYRHFGQVMRYTNRVAELLSDGVRVAKAAILYHAEAEWTGDCMKAQKPAHVLMEAQIDFDFLPADVFADPAHYNANFSDGLCVNGKVYDALIIPTAQFITKAVAEISALLLQNGTRVIFIDKLPEGICDGEASLPEAELLSLDMLAGELSGLKTLSFVPENKWLRALHYVKENDIYFLTNEGNEVWHGAVRLLVEGSVYGYDAYNNQLMEIDLSDVIIEPMHSLILICDRTEEPLHKPLACEGSVENLTHWTRSCCEGAEYPAFTNPKEISLPDDLSGEAPEFSGFVRYETSFEIKEKTVVTLLIEKAAEGIEVFVNGSSAGIQIAQPFRYDLTGLIHIGINSLVIEVATSLEREGYAQLSDPLMKQFTPAPSSPSGLTGSVTLYRKEGL